MDKYTFARNVIRSILKEEAQVNDIVDAIRKKHIVSITYSEQPYGRRMIMPVVYGLSTKGNSVIRAYQVQGVSKTSSHGWKIFLTNKIDSWNPEKDKTFDKPPVRWEDGPYNENGDAKFSQIYVSADFGSEKNNVMYGSKPEIEDNKPQPTEQPNQSLNRQEEPVVVSNSNISGIDKETKPTLQNQEITDMSKTNDFGDENQTSTTGPVYKNDTETTNGVENNVDYSEIYNNNGPKYKKKEKEEPFDNIEFADDEDEEEKIKTQ